MSITQADPISESSHRALIFMIDLFARLQIPYQITGGLAARFYGCSRPLADIDFDVPEERFGEIASLLNDHIRFGPERFRDASWDLLLMTLDYHGQLVDIGGAYDTHFFDRARSEWRPVRANFSTVSYFEYDGRRVPIVNREELVAYKLGLGREVDLLDLAGMQSEKN
jgi:hypothetical protein